MDTTVAELKAFLGIYVYIGVHTENDIQSYWRQDPKLRHLWVIGAMSLNRFEQLNRFFHVSDPCYSGPPHSKVLVLSK